VHPLDGAKTTFTIYGKGHVFAGNIPVCEPCEDLYGTGEDDVLVARRVEFREVSAQDVDEFVRRPLAVLRAADIRTIRVDDLLPPGAAELRAQGFTPVEFLAGLSHIGEAWPAAHRRAIPETRSGRDGNYTPEGVFWLVRSPWTWISTEDVVRTMINWVEQGVPEGDGVGDLINSRMDLFFGLEEHTIRQIHDARQGE
jgi:hypothetical protein